MKVTYEFVDGTKSEVEVSDEIGTMIVDSRRNEDSSDRKERRHCWSLDAVLYEGLEFGYEDETFKDMDEEELKSRVWSAFSHLSALQQRRLLLLSGGLSIREIARKEGKDFKTVYESIEAARKKFKKFF